MLRIALIADVHGNLPALESVAADIPGRGISRVVNLGDHASGPLWPRETVEFLMQQPWVHIAGNHDRQVAFGDRSSHSPSDLFALEQLADVHKRWLATLPAATSMNDESILLCHGTPADDSTYLLETPERGLLRLASADEIDARLGPTTSQLVGCGHSHIPRVVRARSGSTIVNPGSVGLQAYEDTGSTPHISETGSPLARYAVVEWSAAGWCVTLVAVTYDSIAAARRAEANGRYDWAYALRSGYAAKACAIVSR